MPIAEFACVFPRPPKERLPAVAQLVAAVPGYLGRADGEVDLYHRAANSYTAVVVRATAETFTAAVQARVTFWAARAGARGFLVDGLELEDRDRFIAELGLCERAVTGTALVHARDAAARFFRALGVPVAPPPPSGRPLLSVDLDGPGAEGIAYQTDARALFIAGVIAPPVGDALALSVREKGAKGSVEGWATVAEVRGRLEAGPGRPAGFTLRVEGPAPLHEVLARHARALPGRDVRAAPRFPVNAPVKVTPASELPPPPPPAEPVPAAAPASAGRPTASAAPAPGAAPSTTGAVDAAAAGAGASRMMPPPLPRVPPAPGPGGPPPPAAAAPGSAARPAPADAALDIPDADVALDDARATPPPASIGVPPTGPAAAPAAARATGPGAAPASAPAASPVPRPAAPAEGPPAAPAAPAAAAPAGARARVEYATDQELAADWIENLSHGGAFVRTATPQPEGTELAFELALPDGARLEARAVVAFVNAKGMGLRFVLSAEQDQLLATAIARISARPKRALVVDDDALTRQLFADAFAARGFEVLTAPDAKAGLEVLMEELLALDLFVTDVVMPGLSGEELIRTIREAGGEAELAIVAMSGRLDPGIERALEAAGADAVLDKALGAELVAQAADAVLERKRLVRQADAA